MLYTGFPYGVSRLCFPTLSGLGNDFVASRLGSLLWTNSPGRGSAQSIRHFLLRTPAPSDPFLNSGLGEAGVQSGWLLFTMQPAPSQPGRLWFSREQNLRLQPQMAAQQSRVLRVQSSQWGCTGGKYATGPEVLGDSNTRAKLIHLLPNRDPTWIQSETPSGGKQDG